MATTIPRYRIVSILPNGLKVYRCSVGWVDRPSLADTYNRALAILLAKTLYDDAEGTKEIRIYPATGGNFLEVEL